MKFRVSGTDLEVPRRLTRCSRSIILNTTAHINGRRPRNRSDAQSFKFFTLYVVSVLQQRNPNPPLELVYTV